MDRRQLQDELVELMRSYSVEAQQVAEAFAQRHGLHPTDLQALITVLRAEREGDPLTPGRLGEAVGLSSGATTAVIDRLERAGHLERRRDTVDRRRVQLHASAATLGQVAGELRPLLSALDAVAAGLDEHDRAVVVRYLTGALEAYETFARQEADAAGGGR